MFLFDQISAFKQRFILPLERSRGLCHGTIRFALCPLLTWGIAKIPAQANTNLTEGIQQFEQGAWQSALDRLRPELPAQSDAPLTPRQDQALRYTAQSHWQLGQSDLALNRLSTLTQHYRRTGKRSELGRILTQKAQYFTELGNLNQARRLLCNDTFAALKDCLPDSAIQLAIASQDQPGQIAALGSLGILLNKNSELDLAQQALQSALTLSETNLQDPFRIQLLNSLGQTYFRRASREKNYAQLSQQSNDNLKTQLFEGRSQTSLKQAIDLFQQAYERLDGISVNPIHLKTATNLIQAYQAQPTDQTAQIEPLFSQSQTWLTQLPLSQPKLYAAARVAQLRTTPQVLAFNDSNRSATACPSPQENAPPQTLIQPISEITQMARRLNNRDVEAYSLGLLGQVARCQNQFELAQRYTEQAILGSQRAKHRYRWEWQLGQIFHAQGQRQNAMSAYEQAVLTLEQVRGDVVVANRDFQLDLQANIEGLYRDLSYLQLQQVDRLADASTSPLTQRALQNLDRLRLVELQNYLADDCELPPVKTAFANVDQRTAVIRTVMFSDRMAIAISYPGGNNQTRSELHWVNRSQADINAVINQFRFDLEKRSDLTQRYRTGAQTLYDWLINPIDAQLKKKNIDTLVFINDGLLRSIPMATLHDGESFLVESYAIGNATYWSSSPAIGKSGNEMLAFGLTESAQISQYAQPLSFAALPGVKQELAGIQSALKNSQIRIDQEFSPRLLAQTVTQSSPQILHLATHARFGVDPRETFLITGKKQNEEMNPTNATVNMLDLYGLIRTLRTPIRLLALTGCETAVGNERDALGITGVALQAGVETVMASLWQIDDQATGTIVPTFYQNLAQGMPKGKALQQAQIQWLKAQKTERFKHPGYWAPLILVGDWR